MSETQDVAVLTGSLHKDSINRKLALALAELAPAPLKLTMAEIGGLPLYNQDFGADPPQIYKDFRASQGSRRRRSASVRRS
ncbi:MAG TPA: NAD(P)H-dependent oxidoreductase [Methylocella sp.]|nr:NAD(P)H-dependent oxidoreductase [Methylocella sp.]